jgi:pimeloyl-ACP methyl ester carboxylesterase
VLSVTPNSGAHHGGIQAGDVLLAADQTSFTDGAVFREWAASLRAGETCTLWVERDRKIAQKFKITVYERSKERADGIEHSYTQAPTADETLLRVIVSRPTPPQKAVARVLLLPGYRRDSWDWPTATEYPLRKWVEDVVRAGFGVVRVERRGVGDSEGDGSAQGFDEERDDLLHAAKRSSDHWFYGLPWIVYGYSLGGLHAPLVASELGARAVSVWGSGVDTWTEYLDALLRRRMNLEGADETSIETAVRAQQALYATVHIRGETVAQAIARHPALRSFNKLFGLDVERNMIDGRPARFWREVYQCPTASALASLEAPLLALWGECDWLTTLEEHQRIARISPRATLARVPLTDHGYARAQSPLAALRAPSTQYSPESARAFIEWAATVAR